MAGAYIGEDDRRMALAIDDDDDVLVRSPRAVSSRGAVDAVDGGDVGDGARHAVLPSARNNALCAAWRRLSTPAQAGVALLALAALVGAATGVLVATGGIGGGGRGGGRPPPMPRQRPVVVNTWWGDVTGVAWGALNASLPALDAVEAACSFAEAAQKDGTVGFGGSPDTNGETTLDALVMDGRAMDVGAVGYLRDVKSAATAARRVMVYTRHTMLAGDGARDFAALTGLRVEPLNTSASDAETAAWRANNCTPNYYTDMLVNAASGAPGNASCGPYAPLPTPAPTPYPPALGGGRGAAWRVGGDAGAPLPAEPRAPPRPTTRRSRRDHDTVGVCALDVAGNVALGMSSNGAAHKVAGRIGDAPIVGAGGYAANDAGCAAATGDGDITARFLPAFAAVEAMRRGASPADACAGAIRRIVPFYPVFELGLVCMDKEGRYAAASHGWTFTWCAAAPDSGGVATCHQEDPIVP